MLFWSKIVFDEWESGILCSSCRLGLWITLRTTYLTKFPYRSTSTGTSIPWRSISHGWHPVRKTEPGRRHEKALKKSYKAWRPVGTGRTQKQRLALSCCAGSHCLRATCSIGSFLTKFRWTLLYGNFWVEGGEGVIGKTDFCFLGKITCFSIMQLL